jgi:hypothetical protein
MPQPPDPPAQPEIDFRARRWPRGKCWLVLALILLPLAITSCIALRLLLTGGYLRPAGKVAERRSHTRTDEEALVKTFILNNTPDEDAGKVRFLVWGPHLDNPEMRQLLEESGVVELGEVFAGEKIPAAEWKKFEAFRAIVRVRYQAPRSVLKPLWLQGDEGPKTHDELFMVVGKLVIPIGMASGDNWKDDLRKNLSRYFPGIRRP